MMRPKQMVMLVATFGAIFFIYLTVRKSSHSGGGHTGISLSEKAQGSLLKDFPHLVKNDYTKQSPNKPGVSIDTENDVPVKHVSIDTENDASAKQVDGAKDNENDVVTVAKKVSKFNGTVLVTMINDAYLPFTNSWLCNTKTMNIHKSVLIITTDNKSKESLQKNWPEISVFMMEVPNVGGDQVYSHVGYVKIMIRRTEMLDAIVQAGIELFIFEVDCLWLANPVPEFQKTVDYDILVNPVAQRVEVYAGGFLYIYPTEKSKKLWKELTNRMIQLGKRISKMDNKKAISEGDNDQQYLSALISANKKSGAMKIKDLPLDKYADGKWYSLSEGKRNASHPIIINNNWALGNYQKIKRARDWNHWFIKADNVTCDMDLVKKIIY